ncbi:hypothetical protein GOC83_09925 [Haloarcula rubripromontorii]|uniref:Uncharacterized protein n=1 Tax=Haloarcula rubripromontorii TaxID=1705562 RepID=A0A847TZE0_9EURY|nr:hypothetical protein [Haloarcula rubripromontorii]NLV06445.1 hypothetical protein [Haloarcula rubripromontorii]
MATDVWRAADDDGTILAGDPDFPFYVENKEVALSFRDLLSEMETGKTTDISDIAALLVHRRPDIIERLHEDYDDADVEESMEYCEDLQDTEHPSEILDGLESDLEGADIDADDARQLREATVAAVSELEDGEDPHRIFKEKLENYGGDE